MIAPASYDREIAQIYAEQHIIFSQGLIACMYYTTPQQRKYQIKRLFCILPIDLTILRGK